MLGSVSADVAFPIRDRMAYVFAEYFHNDFGMQRMPTAGDRLPPQLQTALLRGEVFNFMRDYLAVGASYQWHPLLTQSLSVISNLNDGSALLQGVQDEFVYAVLKARFDFDGAKAELPEQRWLLVLQLKDNFYCI